MMPVENGFDFAADLRTRSQVPILMLTARGESQDRVCAASKLASTTISPSRSSRGNCCSGSVRCFDEPEPRRRAAGDQRRSLRTLRVLARARRTARRRRSGPHYRARARDAALTERKPRRDRFSRGAVGIRAAPLRSERSTSSSIGCAARSNKTLQIRYTCKRLEEQDIG